MSEPQHNQNNASQEWLQWQALYKKAIKAVRTRKLLGQRQRHLHDRCHM